MRKCRNCWKDKDLSEFYFRNDTKKHKNICKICTGKRIKKYSKNNKEVSKRSSLKCLYGITLEQFNKLLKIQGNRCAICNKKHLKKKSLVVDHCHETNKVRGLLCNNCNTGLGLFKENLKILNYAIDYIEKYGNYPTR